jgi:uncharacterized LabA/DUF88 family protein
MPYKDIEVRKKQNKVYRERSDVKPQRTAQKKIWYQNNKIKISAQKKRWRDNNKEKIKFTNRASWLKTLYKLSVDDYDKLLVQQHGLCAICLQQETITKRGVPVKLCVDHDHITGEVRGLLCNKCNAALGLLKDDPLLIQAAATYLLERKL